MFLGGSYSSLSKAGASSPILFNKLTFYDAVANKWPWQLVSGEIPGQRVGACSVEAAGPNGIFEI